MLDWLLYRTKIIRISVDPETLTLISAEPRPLGVNITPGTVFSADGKPIKLGVLVWKEPRFLPALISNLWKRLRGN